MFGDWGWVSTRTDAQHDRMRQWLAGLQEGGHPGGGLDGDADADGARPGRLKVVVVEAGAGSSVPTVRRTSEQLAHAVGGTLVRINPTEPEVPRGIDGVGLPLGSLDALTRIDAALV